jgi:integrase
MMLAFPRNNGHFYLTVSITNCQDETACCFSRFPEDSPMKLTSKAVAALMLPSGKTDAIFFDDDLPGFGHRLRASGDKVGRSWVAQYRHAGQTRRITLGSAAVLTSEQARNEAKRILAQVALGQDPATEKKRRAAADRFTFAALAEQYLEAKQPVVRRRTFSEAQRYLQDSYFKPLFNLPVDAVTRRDVAARVLIITRENGQVAAARARAALSAMFTWAMENGLAETNPTIGTSKPKAPPSRARTLSDQELTAVWNAAGDDDFGRIVKLLIATGQRRSEVGGITSSEVDVALGTWTIPAARAKNGREHQLPLASLALAVIGSVPPVVGRDLLFGARTDRGFTSWAETKRALDKRLGDEVRPWTLHDLRRTAATRMCDIGVEPHVVEQILNHQSGHRGGVVGVYNKSKYTIAVQKAVAAWDRHLRGLIEGRDERNVIPIRAAGDTQQLS